MIGRRPLDNQDIAGSEAGRAGLLLLYDWFKHMTTLSLITLGGLLSILQAGDANLRPALLTFIVGAIGLAGILGFDGQNRLIKAELAGTPLPKQLQWIRQAAGLCYGLGTGAFLALFLESVA